MATRSRNTPASILPIGNSFSARNNLLALVTQPYLAACVFHAVSVAKILMDIFVDMEGVTREPAHQL